MIAPLRRRHRLIWLALAILLVVAYVASLRARPEEPRMDHLPPSLSLSAAPDADQAELEQQGLEKQGLDHQSDTTAPPPPARGGGP